MRRSTICDDFDLGREISRRHVFLLIMISSEFDDRLIALVPRSLHSLLHDSERHD